MKSYMLRVKASEEEAAAIKERAKAAGETMSGYVRRLAKGRAVQQQEDILSESDLEAIRERGKALKRLYEGDGAKDAAKEFERAVREILR